MFCCRALVAQSGDLVLTPGDTVSSIAGNGVAAYRGDGGAAVFASLASPAGMASDGAGNLYLADSHNHVVRRVDPQGVITTVGGNGRQGFAGDGGMATAAELNTPMAVAVSTDGSLLIADTGNHRVRVISAAGIITTLVGTGFAGFSGDGGAGVLAQLRKPVALAVGAQGDLYIADADDFRVRGVDASGIIHTIAGNGTQGFSGDGGAATDAQLDSPSGIAMDGVGQVYIADRRNERIRVVASDGSIRTIAGDGSASFRDGSALDASLAKPRGVAVDALGNIYVADSGNQRIRRISDGIAGTIAGNGEQGSGGGTNDARKVSMDRPVSVLVAGDGALRFAERGNQMAWKISPAAIAFASTNVGAQSAVQQVTLTNNGAAALTVDAITLPDGFSMQPASCGGVPIHLASASSCSIGLMFVPTSATAYAGEAFFTGTGFLGRSMALSGTGVSVSTPSRIATTTTLSTGGSVAYTTDTIVLSAQVFATQAGMPSGTVQFFDGGSALGTMPVSHGGASWLLASPAAGKHSFSSSYSGDAAFAPSTSAVVSEIVSVPPDFSLNIASSGNASSQTIKAGGTALFPFMLQPEHGSFLQAVTFSASGLPPGATASFDPATVLPGSAAQSVVMAIKTPLAKSAVKRRGMYLALLLFLPACFLRRRARMASLLCLALCTLGCGGFRGSSSTQDSNPAQVYSITIYGTATVAGATVVHSTLVTLSIQN